MTNKFFNYRKYWFNKVSKRWLRTTGRGVLLSHDVWNFFHSNDRILKSDGYVIHHINGVSSDDRIENLQKMTRSEHSVVHGLSYTFTDEGKQKLRNANLGKHHTDKTKQKMKNRWTDELKEENRKRNLDNKNPNWKGGKKK